MDITTIEPDMGIEPVVDVLNKIQLSVTTLL